MREFVVFAIAERGKLHQHIFASRQDRVSEVPTTVEHSLRYVSHTER